MWVIIEGPDGAGKSTLARAVADLSGATIVALGPPESPEAALDAVIGGPFAAYSPGLRGVDLVSDRLHWGDPVYGPIKRPWNDVDGYGEIGRAGWRYAELFAESRGAVTVLVEIDPHVAKMRIAERGDDYVEIADVDDIVARYDWLARDALTIWMRATLAEPGDTRVVAEAAVNAARLKEDGAKPLSRFKHYVGTRWPNLLIVMPPDRDMRLRVVGSCDDEEWRHIGIASTAMTEAMFADLHSTLGEPAVHGFDKVPGHLEHAIVERGGSFTRDVAEVHKFVRT